MKILYLIFFITISSICLGQTFDTIKVVENSHYGRPAGNATELLPSRYIGMVLYNKQKSPGVINVEGVDIDLYSE